MAEGYHCPNAEKIKIFHQLALKDGKELFGN
jgi:hypothetical protein